MDEKVAKVLSKTAEAWRNVMVLYAGAMCSAQILERELVQILYLLHIAQLAFYQERKIKPPTCRQSDPPGAGAAQPVVQLARRF